MEERIDVMVGEAEGISLFEQQVMEELRAQRVYTTMTSLLPVVASSSYIGGNEEESNSSTSTEPRGMVNAPTSQ